MSIDSSTRMTEGFEAIPGLPRRTIVKGAAWSLPVIAVVMALPAASASPCVKGIGVIDWATGYVRSSASTGTATVSTGEGEVVTAHLTSVFGSRTGPHTVTTPNNRVRNLDTYTNGSGTVLNVSNHPAVNASGWRYDARYTQALTITFDRPVSDLMFTVGDVDAAHVSDSDFWAEFVSVGAPGAVMERGGNLAVNGSGTYARAWNNTDENDAANQIRVTIPGPITSLTLNMTSVAATYSSGVWVSPIRFAVPCA